jgi:hypothetical protein
VRDGGYLFIWVYGADDHMVRSGLVGIATRAQFAFERVARPVVSRLPKRARQALFFVLAAIIHPLMKARLGGKSGWTLRNTNHGLRDWMSPRFAHRHGYNEVLEWLYEHDCRPIGLQSPGEYRRLFNRRLWGVGVSGQKIARARENAA